MYLYGAGGHAKVIRDILECSGVKIAGVIDDNPDIDTFMGMPITRSLENVDEVIVCIGNCKSRQQTVEKLKKRNIKFGRAIHPSAIISPFAEIGEGSVVMPGAVINSGSKVGCHCIVNSGAVVEHDCILGDFVHVSPYATLCGGLSVGSSTWIGAGAVVVHGMHIGAGCMIGAGSVVLHHIPDGVVAYGNPCKIIRNQE